LSASNADADAVSFARSPTLHRFHPTGEIAQQAGHVQLDPGGRVLGGARQLLDRPLVVGEELERAAVPGGDLVHHPRKLLDQLLLDLGFRHQTFADEDLPDRLPPRLLALGGSATASADEESSPARTSRSPSRAFR
jgi:hypothetical protein